MIRRFGRPRLLSADKVRGGRVELEDVPETMQEFTFQSSQAYIFIFFTRWDKINFIIIIIVGRIDLCYLDLTFIARTIF